MKPTKTQKESLLDYAVFLVAYSMIVLLLVGALAYGQSKVDGGTPPTTRTIQEDEDGWDCRIHGNRRCEPLDTTEVP